MSRPNPCGLFPTSRFTESRLGVVSRPDQVFDAAVTRLTNWWGARARLLSVPEGWSVYERQVLDSKIAKVVVQLGRARASGGLVLIRNCPDADRLVDAVAQRCAPVCDPKKDDLLPLAVAESMSDRTPKDDPAYCIAIRNVEEGVEEHEQQTN
jgi:hypothetical protein